MKNISLPTLVRANSLCMFVRHTKSNSADANQIHKAGNQEPGRQMGESPTALLLRRNDFVCSDLPFLLHNNFHKMHTKSSNWHGAEFTVSRGHQQTKFTNFVTQHLVAVQVITINKR